MAKIGRIEKPTVDSFKEGRKLYLIPLLYSGEGFPQEYNEICDRYWDEVEEHLSSLEAKIGKAEKIYHEAVSRSGEDGVKLVEKLNFKSYEIVKKRSDQGAVLEALENKDIFEEFSDWQRCLMILVSENARRKVFELYVDTAKKRYEHAGKVIDETLSPGEVGLLIISENHQIQFKEDINVFYISPSSLDEAHRWIRDQAEGKKRD